MDNENSPFGVEYNDLTFRSLGDKVAVNRVNKNIKALIEALHDEDAEAKKNVIRGELTIKVTFERVIDTGNINIGIVSSPKFPAQRGSYQSGMTRGHGRVVVPVDYDDDGQTGMFDGEKTKH